jgi:hypothetical protein
MKLITRLTTAITLALFSGALIAADHRDSPLATADVSADINDVYTFVNPRNPAETIVAVTVSPVANALSSFSSAVDYRIHIDNGTGDKVITCRFPGSTRVECGGIAGLSASGSVGRSLTGMGGLRLFTGLRDDPFFFDLAAFNATRVALAPRFNNPGTNFFRNLNTLSIVLAIPNAAVTDNGARNVLKVYASTVRTGGDGIGAGISGSWYDAANPGQGILLEVIPTTGGADRMNAVWTTYDNGGRQLWLAGTGSIAGNAATVPMSLTYGGTFPPPGGSANVRTLPFGDVKLTFSDCNNAKLDYATSVPNLPTSGSVTLSRLTSISGASCALLRAGQLDRMGRPGINTALINLVPATGSAIKEAYNRAEGVANWTQFTGEMTANLAALDTLDGRANAVLPPATLASVLVDDRLIIDVSKPACDEYLAVELGVAGKCGGRTLNRDVIDDTLGAVVGTGVSDFVNNDNANNLSDFPFLADPN